MQCATTTAYLCSPSVLWHFWGVLCILYFCQKSAQQSPLVQWNEGSGKCTVSAELTVGPSQRYRFYCSPQLVYQSLLFSVVGSPQLAHWNSRLPIQTRMETTIVCSLGSLGVYWDPQFSLHSRLKLTVVHSKLPGIHSGLFRTYLNAKWPIQSSVKSTVVYSELSWIHSGLFRAQLNPQLSIWSLIESTVVYSEHTWIHSCFFRTYQNPQLSFQSILQFTVVHSELTGIHIWWHMIIVIIFGWNFVKFDYSTVYCLWFTQVWLVRSECGASCAVAFRSLPPADMTGPLSACLELCLTSATRSCSVYSSFPDAVNKKEEINILLFLWCLCLSNHTFSWLNYL